jgi:hypothetical protein
MEPLSQIAVSVLRFEGHHTRTALGAVSDCADRLFHEIQLATTVTGDGVQCHGRPNDFKLERVDTFAFWENRLKAIQL